MPHQRKLVESLGLELPTAGLQELLRVLLYFARSFLLHLRGPPLSRVIRKGMAFHVDAGLSAGVGSNLDFKPVDQPAELHVSPPCLAIILIAGNPVLCHIDRALPIPQERQLALDTLKGSIGGGGGLGAGGHRIVLATGREKPEGPHKPAGTP